MTAASELLDTTVRIVTPENIAFNYRLAGPFRRLPAFVVDCIIFFTVVIALAIASDVATSGPASQGILRVVLFFMFWGYGGFFETVLNGQTPGKKAFGIRVVSTGGFPINAQQAVLRNLLRPVDTVFFPWILGFSFLLTRRFQRLGDLAADTMVVVEEGHRLRKVEAIAGEEVDEMASRIPPSFQADPALAEALASYVARRTIQPVPRRLSMASHLAKPLANQFGLPDRTDPDLLLCALYKKVYM